MSGTPSGPPPCPLFWEGGIDDYLLQNGISCEKVTSIETGTSCYIWRLDGFKHADSSASHHQLVEPVVLKCADRTPKYSSDQVSPDRLQTEVQALTSKAVSEACRQEPSVQVPRVLRTTAQGFIMTWAGDANLMQAFQSDKSLDVASIGSRIGKWLACLQLAGIAAGPGGFPSVNPELGRFYNPGGFQDQLVRSVISSDDEYERVLTALRETEAVRTLTAWDFRPMNNLLRFPEEKGAAPDITIVDWELTQHGESSGDVAMWATEAMVLEEKHGDRGLLSSFLSSYRHHAAAGIVNEAFTCKVAMTVGVMLVYFMRIAARLWGSTEEEVARWKETAVLYLRAGTERNLTWLTSSHLKPLVGSSVDVKAGNGS
ncbi:hypothetical protein DL766_004715 [Monosporascus sp. MC13-8B]|nr:hypothetical protein DL766_004715 [Monosporascus sp. MC13-8B]